LKIFSTIREIQIKPWWDAIWHSLWWVAMIRMLLRGLWVNSKPNSICQEVEKLEPLCIFLLLFWFFVGLDFVLRCLTYTSSPFYSGYFGDGVLSPGGPQTSVLLISASQGAKITAVSHHWHPAPCALLMRMWNGFKWFGKQFNSFSKT
jgi:hypothetical protein